MDDILKLCYWYATDGYPNFRPICNKGRMASLKCHSIRHDCPDYQDSSTPRGARYEIYKKLK